MKIFRVIVLLLIVFNIVLVRKDIDLKLVNLFNNVENWIFKRNKIYCFKISLERRYKIFLIKML